MYNSGDMQSVRHASFRNSEAVTEWSDFCQCDLFLAVSDSSRKVLSSWTMVNFSLSFDFFFFYFQKLVPASSDSKSQ